VISISDSGIQHVLPGDLLVGGAISGLLKYQNEDLVSARNQLGQMAASVAARVNAIQGHGIDMGSPAGPGDAVFAVGGPVAIANSHNARDAAGGFASSVTLTVTDGTQLKASDYTLAADPANSGSYIVTRASDGVKFAMAPNGSDFAYTRLSDNAAMGNSIDGFQIAFNGTPDPADTFELEPVGRAAVGMTRVLDDPNGIAAAAPMTAVMGVANKGTATVAGLSVVSPANDPNVSAAISFTDANGGFAYTLTDAGGNVTASGNATWTPGQPISLNGFELNLDGVPASGDTIAVGKTAHPESNNGNALAMVALRDESFVGRDMQIDGSVQGGETATDAYASVLANVGVRVQSARTASTISSAASAEADSAVASKSGVNLDEEAGRLIQFQQGYQAAAKVLQVAQAIFDTLLQMASH
jgi:flagellar hook-associated protein 1 FlgK